MIGDFTRHEFEPGKLANPMSWLKPADFENTRERIAQADRLAAHDLASIFLRFRSGHSNTATVQHEQFNSGQYPYRYLLHGTHGSNLQLIRQRGLLPGATRGSRKDVHVTLAHTLSTMNDSLRPESDCILVAK